MAGLDGVKRGIRPGEGNAFGPFDDNVFDWPEAEAAYKRAIELDPNEPQARIFYSHFLAQLHRVEESDEQIARARGKARGQISFYGSTPAYKPVLDIHGWGGLQEELNKLSKQGKWLEMMSYITDEMLDVIGVVGTPAEAGAKLRKRNRFADRTSLIVYNETGDPDAVTQLIQAAR